MIFRKCDPECEHAAWRCVWDNSRFHAYFCMYGFGPFKLGGNSGIYGPLWFLCKGCRELRRG